MISGASNENLPNNEWFEYDDNSSFQSGVDQSAVQALIEQQGPSKPKVTVQRLATSYDSGATFTCTINTDLNVYKRTKA